MVLEVDSKQGLGERRLDSVNDGLLLHWRDGVDGAHSETQKTVGACVLGELGRNGLGSLDGLRGGRDGANSD